MAESDRIVVYGQHANPLESDAYLVDTRDGSVQPIASLPKGNGGAMAGRNFALSPNGEHAVLYQPHRFQIFAVSETLKLPMTNTLEIAPSKTITTAREQSKEYLQQYSFAQRDISGLPNQENVSLEGWLPDSETLIQTYYENNPAFPLSDQIQTWDSRTGQIANFGWARTVWFFRAPFWLDSIDSMGYVGPIGEYHLLLSGLANQNLWIAQAGTVTTTTPALSNIVAATGRDETVIALTSQPRQMVEYNVITKQTRVLPVDVGDIGSPLQNGDSDYDVVMKWHPTLPLVAISSGATFSVYNTEAETLSRLSLGMPSVVFDALPTASNFSWNPVEPELVVYVTDARFTMAGRKEWMILNAETGLLTPLVFWDYQITGAVWAPNGRDLLLFAHDENWAAPFMPQALLFDTKIGVWVQLDDLVEATDTQGAIYEAFWSPDGERLALQYIDRRYIFDATLPPSGAVR